MKKILIILSIITVAVVALVFGFITPQQNVRDTSHFITFEDFQNAVRNKNCEEIWALSAECVRNYYENNITKFRQACTEDIERGYWNSYLDAKIVKEEQFENVAYITLESPKLQSEKLEFIKENDAWKLKFGPACTEVPFCELKDKNFECMEFVKEDTSINLVLLNNANKEMKVLQISYDGSSLSKKCEKVLDPVLSVSPGKYFTLSADNCLFKKKSGFTVLTYNIKYYFDLPANIQQTSGKLGLEL